MAETTVLGNKRGLEDSEGTPRSGGSNRMVTFREILKKSQQDTLSNIKDDLRTELERLVEKLDKDGFAALIRECKECLLQPQQRYIPEFLIVKADKLPEDILQFIADSKVEESLGSKVSISVYEISEKRFTEILEEYCSYLLGNLADTARMEKLCNKLKSSKRLMDGFGAFCIAKFKETDDNRWADIALVVILRCYMLNPSANQSSIQADVLLAAQKIERIQEKSKNTEEYLRETKSLFEVFKKIALQEYRKERDNFDVEEKAYKEYLDNLPKHVKAAKPKSEPQPPRPKRVNPLIDKLAKDIALLRKKDIQRIFEEQVKVHGYSKHVKKPMWIKRLEERVNSERYKTMDEFVEDVELMFSNCVAFNTEENYFGQYAIVVRNQWKHCRNVLAQEAESHIDGPNWLLKDVWDSISNLDVVKAFANKVDILGYEYSIDKPMDLDTIRRKLSDNGKAGDIKYDLTMMSNDVVLMLDNCAYFDFRPFEGFYYEYAKLLRANWNHTVAFYKEWAENDWTKMKRFFDGSLTETITAIFALESLDAVIGNNVGNLRKVIGTLWRFVGTQYKIIKGKCETAKIDSALNNIKDKAENHKYKNLDEFEFDMAQILTVFKNDQILATDSLLKHTLKFYRDFRLLYTVLCAKFPYFSSRKSSEGPTMIVVEPPVVAESEAEQKAKRDAEVAAVEMEERSKREREEQKRHAMQSNIKPPPEKPNSLFDLEGLVKSINANASGIYPIPKVPGFVDHDVLELICLLLRSTKFQQVYQDLTAKWIAESLKTTLDKNDKNPNDNAIPLFTQSRFAYGFVMQIIQVGISKDAIMCFGYDEAVGRKLIPELCFSMLQHEREKSLNDSIVDSLMGDGEIGKLFDSEQSKYSIERLRSFVERFDHTLHSHFTAIFNKKK